MISKRLGHDQVLGEKSRKIQEKEKQEGQV
jgi:hypothetical protein